jgi:hypothetical protein
MLVLTPPFESAREQLFNSFFDCQSGIKFYLTINYLIKYLSFLVITSQKRIKNSRYQVNSFI